MKVLVTGGAGYLGSVLVPKLLVRGHQVKLVDIGYFGLGHLQALRPAPEIVREDLRSAIGNPEYCDRLIDGCDAIIHLAAISNDPSAELQPELTHETNYLSTVALAEAAKRRGVKFPLLRRPARYTVRLTGCSMKPVRENPLTVYAVSKVQSEEALEKLADDKVASRHTSQRYPLWLLSEDAV